MQDMNSLTHSVWICKYHVVWIPKCRKKKLYADIAKYLEKTFHELAMRRESRIVEGHICPYHIHTLIEIPPKYSIVQVVGYIKGKSAIHIARTYRGRKQNLTGKNFWVKGYCVSTEGRDEESIKKYIREQEVEDKRLDQLEFFKDN